MHPSQFIQCVLRWYNQEGRHDLPWQQNINPYRVWVSEIMLQQTQVATVIPYFNRFMQTFPTLQHLSAAPIDEVLHLWTGLGYYARARHLHQTANILCKDYAGRYPATVEAWAALPGVGESTAGAIVSISYDTPATVLDGNIKRVLARFDAIDGWPGDARVHQTLWQLASLRVPVQRCRDYTQAMMDLGATRCTRSAPQCHHCPLQSDCKAHLTGTILRYPGKKPSKKLPVKKTILLVLQNPAGDIFLEKRPDTGIWGGLFSLPELQDASMLHQTDYLRNIRFTPLPAFRHTFSHYHLDITPLSATLSSRAQKKLPKTNTLWYKSHHTIGLPAPVKKIISEVWHGT